MPVSSASRATDAAARRVPPPASRTGRLARRSSAAIVAAVSPLERRPRDGRRRHHVRIEDLAEDVHRHRHEDRAGPARERRVPRPGQDPRHLVRPTDAPGALHERLVDRHLVRVAAEVELLVRAAPLVVRRDVPGDHDQRDRVEGRRRDARRRVRHARPDMDEERRRDARSPARTRPPRAPPPARGAPSRSAARRAARTLRGSRCSCGRTARRPARRRDRRGISRHDRRPWASPRPPRRAHLRWPPAVVPVPNVGIAFVQKERSIRKEGVSSPHRRVD